ncbi:hypothetical protein AD933_09280 [Acetobacter malorum]|uniref:Uncharacterized protein n=1 Tax=Acetobacter malorum TaxID=178901 RepID=A0A149RMY5_9PROT|nr:hypothetical protein AD933_09280 [Acetobacter malorum]
MRLVRKQSATKTQIAYGAYLTAMAWLEKAFREDLGIAPFPVSYRNQNNKAQETLCIISMRI